MQSTIFSLIVRKADTDGSLDAIKEQNDELVLMQAIFRASIFVEHQLTILTYGE
jgi:hypothetical protein